MLPIKGTINSLKTHLKDLVCAETHLIFTVLVPSFKQALLTKVATYII